MSTERTRQASCCTSGRRELNFALTWIAVVFGSKTWLETTVARWTEHISWVFSTFLSEKCNCHAVSLWSRAYSLGFGTLEAGILATVVLLPIGLSENCFSVSSVQERLVLLASQLLPSTLIGSNNVQVARLVMGCHECIRACLGMFLCISSQHSSKPSSGVGKW